MRLLKKFSAIAALSAAVAVPAAALTTSASVDAKAGTPGHTVIDTNQHRSDTWPI